MEIPCQMIDWKCTLEVRRKIFLEEKMGKLAGVRKPEKLL